MDLDNIDNVFRVACRFGLKCDPSSAERLARSFSLSGTMIRLAEGDLGLLEEWQRTRAEVYEVFFTHPDILAMKALLTYSVEYCLKNDVLHESDWVYTDTQLLEALLKVPGIKHEVRQIMLGHELKCHSLLAIPVADFTHAMAQLPALREEIAANLTVEDTRRRKTDNVLAFERDYGTRRLYMTAEYDKGSTTRRCEVEVVFSGGRSAVRTLGTNSNRLVLSLQLPRWCRLAAPHAGEMMLSATASRLGCEPQDIVQLAGPGEGARRVSAEGGGNGNLFEE
jgi:hypothetical protein